MLFAEIQEFFNQSALLDLHFPHQCQPLLSRLEIHRFLLLSIFPEKNMLGFRIVDKLRILIGIHWVDECKLPFPHDASTQSSFFSEVHPFNFNVLLTSSPPLELKVVEPPVSNFLYREVERVTDLVLCSLIEFGNLFVLPVKVAIFVEVSSSLA